MLAGLLTDLNIPSLTAPPKAGPFAINGVVESQKSEGTRCYSRYRWDALNAATLLGIDLVIAVPPRQTICS